jgi:2-polyprenyl-6-methoxyphenol hydroxylase-like FAD-dependent oxidoreductase
VRVVIAGAGIGGLVTALALHEHGIDVQVHEAVQELRPLGVGINLLPHAMGVLDGLGVLDELLPLGVQTAELCFFNRHGQLIWRESRGLAAGYPVPQLSVHRGRLQMALLAAVRRRLGDDAVRTGHRLLSFQDDAGAPVRIELEDRANETTVVDAADLLVGADGIGSRVRATFHPDEGLPSWSGSVLWRATSRGPAYLTGRSMFMAGHLPHKFVAYPLTAADDDGTCTINWIAELDRRSHGLRDRADWNRVGDPADFARRFDDWRWPWLDVPDLIANPDGAIYEFPMVDRDPLERWTHGRVTLLGDAAHPMYPVGSNGASQAILDARALADALVANPSLDEALSFYEAERRTKTAGIVLANRKHGPEVVMDLAEARAPDGFTDVADVFAPGELEGIAAQYKQVAGFQVPGRR